MHVGSCECVHYVQGRVRTRPLLNRQTYVRVRLTDAHVCSPEVRSPEVRSARARACAGW